MPFIPGNEDCLFLNVFAPANAQNLPVVVYIHGGGYGYGDATQDMTDFINANGNNFIAVGIQYRVSLCPLPRVPRCLSYSGRDPC
jgi:carboxylesterase type B